MVRTKKTKEVEEEVKEGADVGGEESVEESEEVEEATPKDAQKETKPESGATKVTFHVRNPNARNGQSTRVFSLGEHGEGFMDLANSFGEANTLRKPANMTDTVEVSACVEHNKNIKHGILSRVDE